MTDKKNNKCTITYPCDAIIGNSPSATWIKGFKSKLSHKPLKVAVLRLPKCS